MSIRICKGKGGFFSTSTCIGKVSYSPPRSGQLPSSITVQYGTGFFGEMVAKGECIGKEYQVAVLNMGHSLISPLKERTFRSDYLSSNSNNPIKIKCDDRSHIGYCQDGKILSIRNTVIGTYSCESNDLSPQAAALLAAIGAGLLLNAELNNENRYS